MGRTHPTVNQRRRNRIAVLERRRDFLARRVADYDGDHDYDKAELMALSWALRIIRSAESNDVLDDLENVT